jgi:hypothetical protein
VSSNLPKIPIQFNDVAVLLLGYNRPELLKKRILQVCESEVANIYISIDGGFLSHTPEMDSVKMFAENVFRNCALCLTHHEENLGMTRHITSSISKVLSIHDFVIVVEDDVILSKNFIQNMLLGLNVLREKEYLGVVSGYSPFFNKSLNNKWRQIYIPNFWGWACSKDTWENYNFDLSTTCIEDDLSKSNLWKSMHKFQQEYLLGQFFKLQRDPLFTWDVQMWFHLLKNDFESIAPIFAFSGNEGFGDARAEHTIYNKPRNIKNHKISERLVSRTTNYSYFYGVLHLPLLKHELKKFLKKVKYRIEKF